MPHFAKNTCPRFVVLSLVENFCEAFLAFLAGFQTIN